MERFSKIILLNLPSSNKTKNSGSSDKNAKGSQMVGEEKFTKNDLSVVAPDFYAERFVAFCKD